MLRDFIFGVASLFLRCIERHDQVLLGYPRLCGLQVDGWARSVPGRVPGGGLDGIPSGPAAVDSDYYYYYYAPHSVNPRLAGSLRDGLGGSRILAVRIWWWCWW